jgi:dienelactone hydrolase
MSFAKPAVAVFALLAAACASAQTGKMPFDSVTPKNRFELASASYDPKPTAIWGTLALPALGHAPYPAMVLAHGSGGIECKDWERWVPLLNQLGVATFVVDSFTPRGIARTVDDQSQLDQSANDADALAALQLLARDPRIDPARIGVMGFSRGGSVALETAVDRFRRGVIRNDVKFAAHIAFYPGCSLRYWRTPSPLTGAPILLALGELDNYTPPRSCLAFAEAMKAAGQDVEVHVYPGAQHDFDSTFPRLVTHPHGTSSRDCPDREIDPVSWTFHMLATGETIKDAAAFTQALGKCVATGVTTGGNPVAAAQAEHDVKAFVTRVLKR